MTFREANNKILSRKEKAIEAFGCTYFIPSASNVNARWNVIAKNLQSKSVISSWRKSNG